MINVTVSENGAAAALYPIGLVGVMIDPDDDGEGVSLSFTDEETGAEVVVWLEKTTLAAIRDGCDWIREATLDELSKPDATPF